jgi:hypothetical protein
VGDVVDDHLAPRERAVERLQYGAEHRSVDSTLPGVPSLETRVLRIP